MVVSGKASIDPWELAMCSVQFEWAGAGELNPLTTRTDGDIDACGADYGFPVHPLTTQGYRSIGRRPVARAVGPGEEAHAGLWAGTDKTKCGLHT
jgi:phosphoadenosine phosphosulfate reductase